MRQIEIAPEVFIQPMSRNDWTDKVLSLIGDEKVTFVEKSTQFHTLSDSICLMVFKTNREGVVATIQQAGIDFDPERDIIFVNYGKEAVNR